MRRVAQDTKHTDGVSKACIHPHNRSVHADSGLHCRLLNILKSAGWVLLAALIACGPTHGPSEPSSKPSASSTRPNKDPSKARVPMGKRPVPPLTKPDVAKPSAPLRLPPVKELPAVVPTDFVGAKVCGQCHAKEYKSWSFSAHGQAGGPPSDALIIPRFGGQSLTFADGRIILEKKDNRFAMVVQHLGRAPRRYEIHGVVGRGLMNGGGAQTYFHRSPDGRTLLLPLEYNVQKKTWFCQTGGPKKWAPIDGTVKLADCEWPPQRALGVTPGQACQNCHGSQINVEFDENKGAYKTSYEALHINCESCHGPGRHHVELTRAGKAGGTKDIGMTPLGLRSPRDSVLVCMACHGNKPNVTLGYLSGHDFDTYFSNLVMWTTADRKTHFDGRLTGFGYQEGHLYSACYTEGSMTCVDCHSPHGLDYRDIYGTKLTGRWSDKQCIDCHPAKAGTNHSRHQTGTKADRCTSCHMPYHQLAPVGDTVPHGRSDHVIPIPRPVHDASLGLKDACTRCHRDQSPETLAQKAASLYGTIKPLPHLVRELFDYSRRLGPRQEPKGGSSLARIERLVADFESSVSLVAVYAVNYLVGEILAAEKATPGPATLKGLWRAAASRDLDVAAASLAALVLFADGDDTSARQIEKTLTQHKQANALRRTIALNLIGIDRAFSGLNARIRNRIRRRLETDGLVVDPQKHEMLPTIGASLLADGEYVRAGTYFKRAAALPQYARNNYPVGILGARHDLLNLVAATQGSLGRMDAAISTLKEILALFPFDPQARQRLCRTYEREGRWRDFNDCLRDWIEYHPDFLPPYGKRAQLLTRLGRHSEALQVLEAGLERAPNHPELTNLARELKRKSNSPRPN